MQPNSLVIAGLVFGALALGGCSPQQQQKALDKCIAQAKSEITRQDGQSAEEVHDAMGQVVEECMKDSGYRHDQTSARCIDDVDFNVSCYTPRRVPAPQP